MKRLSAGCSWSSPSSGSGRGRMQLAARHQRFGHRAARCGHRRSSTQTRNGRCRTRTRRPPATARLERDQYRERQEPEGGVDVLDRRAARPRRRAARRRQHDVRAHALPQHRLRARPDARKARRSSGSTRRSRIAAVIPVACCDTVNRGVAYADGKIFLNQLDTNTVALDAETGKELWKVKQGDYKQGQTITSAPMVIKDKVISGISRRRVRRARLRHRQRRQHRQAGLADVQHRPRGRGRLPRLGRDLEGRRVEARRRHDVGLVQLRPRARTSSTTAPATPDRGIPISAPATTSTR